MYKSKRIIAAAISAALSAAAFCSGTAFAADKLAAFPGAEGGGKYTTGARGSSAPEVYHVTNLNAEGKGSFADAVSKSGRIIVFDVGGAIELEKTLKIQNNDLTILGQTAPGDGITFTGADILIGNGVQNVIMRYLRIRPTDKNGGEYDGLGGRWNKNIIIDHCSVSWSIDETLTLYAGSSESEDYTPSSNVTLQNTIGSESLRMSNHFKGSHGYGGIWGGTNSSYHHNLMAHHDSRSPRLDRELNKTDVRYNVIYDWGRTNSAYGGEPYSYNNITQAGTSVNWVGNYYKYGPSTAESLKTRIFDISNNEGIKPYAKFCFADNYVYGSEAVTNDNSKGINNIKMAELMPEPFSMGEYELDEETAQEAYEYVLDNAGATLPKRDATDARIVADVKGGTGRVINNADEAAGYIKPEETYREFKIPRSWIIENGLDGYKEADIIQDGEFKGYTLIEAYVNDWTQMQAAPSNPQITVLSPAIASLNDTVNGRKVDNSKWTVADSSETVLYNAVTDASGGYDITKIELYDGSELIETVFDDEISKELKLSPGVHYLSCRAYNSNGEQTQSTESIVYITSSDEESGWDVTQIGGGSFSGKETAWSDDTGKYYVAGSGRIGSTKDSCGYMYKLLKGDFDISLRLEDIPKFENFQLNGIMMRETLDESSPMIMLADGWLKYGENVRSVIRYSSGAAAEEHFFTDKDGKELSNSSSYNTQEDYYRVPKYIRMQRAGNEITVSVSDSGADYTDNTRQPMTYSFENLPEMLYVGFAVDSAEGENPIDYFSIAAFSELKLNADEARNKLWVDRDKIYGVTSYSSALLYAAEYNDGILCGVKVKRLTTEKEDCLDIPESEKVTAILWTDGQKPLCKKLDIEQP